VLVRRQKLGTFKLEQFLYTVPPPQPVNYRLFVPQNSCRLNFLLRKRVFNTRVTSGVIRKDFWLACLS
jgi:hypothetical protein